MNIYLIPGLGYDHRIFEKLDFGNRQVEYLTWMEPKPNEAITDYAKRMFSDLLTDEDEVVLIGHSLGAIMAQEIATVRKVKKIILISSIKSREELSLAFKLIAPLHIHKLFTKKLCINTVKYWGKAHGFESTSEQDLFKSMLAQQSNTYLQWALKSLSIWKTPKIPPETSLFHIHGTNDKTLAFKLINQADVIIENGSHIMVYKRHQEISDIILKEL